jgi:hypothetical protein
LQEFLDGPKSLLSCCLSFEWCGEGELRTPKHDDRKSSSYIYIVVQIILTVKIGGKNARMSNTKKAREKKPVFSSTYILAERGDYVAPFSTTLLFSITSFVKPAFSVV